MGEVQSQNPPKSWFRPMTLLLGLTIGILAAIYPLLNEPYREWNFAAFGAIGLFLAARAGFIPGILLMLAAKLVFDLLNYRMHNLNPELLPSPTLYLCFAFYPLFGYLLLRRTESPLAIGGVALMSGISFFLITNFMSWLSLPDRYPQTFVGLMESYGAALPFYRGTLVSDLAFTGVLFGLQAVLSRAYFPAERVAIAATA